MDKKTLIEDLFPRLSGEEKLLDEIVRYSSVRKFSKGDILIDYGADIAFVPLVISGLIKIMRENEDDREVLLYFLSSGNTCAASFSCCLIKKRSEIKAVCEEDSTILFIPLEFADRWLEKYSTWRNFVFEMMEERLFSMIDTVDRLAFANLDEKLWDYLTERCFLQQSEEINTSHLEIARDLNASREAISRMLKKLEDKGQVKLDRNKITLLETI